jgi:hypothetical protein
MNETEMIIKNIYDLLFQLEKQLEKETKKTVRAYASGRISGLHIALTIIESLKEDKLEKHYNNIYE